MTEKKAARRATPTAFYQTRTYSPESPRAGLPRSRNEAWNSQLVWQRVNPGLQVGQVVPGPDDFE
jgi:hypothetical protein